MKPSKLEKIVVAVVARLDSLIPQTRVDAATAKLLDAWVEHFKMPMAPFQDGATWVIAGHYYTADERGWMEVFPQVQPLAAKVAIVRRLTPTTKPRPDFELLSVWPPRDPAMTAAYDFGTMSILRAALAVDWNSRVALDRQARKARKSAEQDLESDEVEIDLSPVSTPTPPAGGPPLSPVTKTAVAKATASPNKVRRVAKASNKVKRYDDDEDYDIKVTI